MVEEIIFARKEVYALEKKKNLFYCETRGKALNLRRCIRSSK